MSQDNLEDLIHLFSFLSKMQQQIQAALLEDQKRANMLKAKEMELNKAQDVSRIQASDLKIS